MNILFVNYGDFTTNSLNHIGGFASKLCETGHVCAVAVPTERDVLETIGTPLYIPITYEKALERPKFFPNGRGADIIHAWTPRETVRSFVLGYEAKIPTRLITHLEDNELFLLESYTAKDIGELKELEEEKRSEILSTALSHPIRRANLLRFSDAVTVIEKRLGEHVPAGPKVTLLRPGLDEAFTNIKPRAQRLRKKLGIKEDEKVIVYCGGTSFATESEIRELYLAVAILNRDGTPTRLIRTGFTSPQFTWNLPKKVSSHVVDLGIVDRNRLPGLLALADVLVQPGQAGPFNDYRLPSKLPEFLASGRPVILPATNIGLELRDGEDALLLHRGTPDEIVSACQKVFGDTELAKRLGKNGAAFAREHFDLDKNAAGLLALYLEVLEQPPRADWKTLGTSGVAEVAMLTQQAFDLVDANDEFSKEVIEQIRMFEDELRDLSDQRDLFREQRENTKHTDKHIANLDELVTKLRNDLGLSQQHGANLDSLLKEAQSYIKKQADAYDESVKHFQVKFTELHGAIDEARKENVRLREQSANLDRLLNEVSQLEGNVGDLRKSNEDLRAIAAESNAVREGLADKLDREATRMDHLVRKHEHELALRNHEIRDLERNLSARDQEIALRGDKIRRMQKSFSWRATSPLRAIRRLFFDRRQKKNDVVLSSTPSTADELEGPREARFSDDVFGSMDIPQTFGDMPIREFTIEGWVLHKDERRTTKSIRAKVGERMFVGKHQVRRVDVQALFPKDSRAEKPGFLIQVMIPEDKGVLELQTLDEDGTWITVYETPFSFMEGAAERAPAPFELWMENAEDFSADGLQRLRDEAAAWENPPLISILMPVYNTPEMWLTKSIESVVAQTYDHWELCIADDASTEEHVREILESFAKKDPRIKVVFREENGHISASSNSALGLATGKWIALLDHDDELAPHALHEVAALLIKQPDTDLVYSDEDKIDTEGERSTPYFKPDFLPDLFTAQNYLSHLSVYRASLIKKIGGFRVGYEGSQDWDLALRFIERIRPERIRHIPKILYHWRAIPGSTALLLSEKNYPVEAARKALADHYHRLDQPVGLISVPGDHWRTKFPVPTPEPLVSLIIPTRNGLHLLKRCVESILGKTTYPAYEIIIVDNGSDDPETVAWLARLEGTGEPKERTTNSKSIRVVRDPSPFNYSALNNRAVARARGEYVGLLNNDLEVITPEWLEEMVSQAARPGIGCVGAMLYYPDDTIQHAGVILGVGGVAGHAFKTFPRGAEGVFNRARLVQNYSAVTAACMVVRKSIYEEVGGLGEKTLAVSFNDIDFCLKVMEAGYRNLWTPHAEFYHHESASRGYEDTPDKHNRFRSEIETMHERWGNILAHDPAYSPNLTLEREDFSVAPAPTDGKLPLALKK